MGITLALIFIGVPIVLVLTAVLFVRWLFKESSESDAISHSRGGKSSVFGKLFKWLNKPVPKLVYRRDRKGRFRKIWRG